MNEREKQLLSDIKDAYGWIEGDNGLEMTHWNLSEDCVGGWYVWEYNGSESRPVDWFEEPLITDDEIEKHDVDVYKVLDVVGCAYCG